MLKNVENLIDKQVKHVIVFKLNLAELAAQCNMTGDLNYGKINVILFCLKTKCLEHELINHEADFTYNNIGSLVLVELVLRESENKSNEMDFKIKVVNHLLVNALELYSEELNTGNIKTYYKTRANEIFDKVILSSKFNEFNLHVLSQLSEDYKNGQNKQKLKI